MTTLAHSEHDTRIRAILSAARQRLSASARLDCEVLLAHVLQRPRSSLYAHPDDELSPAEFRRLTALLTRRLAGEPIAYLTGEREFWSLPLTVTPATLIPRPETELLVELAVGLLRDKPDATVADLGTGSGAIAIALARELPDARIIATDCCAVALAVARRNADRHCRGRIDFRHGDWCAPLAGEQLDLIVANPPYVMASDSTLAEALRFEPRSALAAGELGMDALAIIIESAVPHLRPGGGLLLEHGAGQATAVCDRLSAHEYGSISTHTDLAGLPRATLARCRQ